MKRQQRRTRRYENCTFFALDDADEVLVCCMISPLPNGEWEIEKFAARGMYTGTGAGGACLRACIEYAKEKRVDKVVIVSNRRCTHASDEWLQQAERNI